MSDYRYDVIVKKVIDGDTIVVDLDYGFSHWHHGMVIRLHGINAPELSTPEGKEAQRHLLGLIITTAALGKAVFEIETIRDKPDKYGGRYLGILWVPGGTLSINQQMVLDGHAVPWDGKGVKP